MVAWRRFRERPFRSKTCQFFEWRRGSANMLVTPDGWGGNFFNTWTRTASQFEALPILQLPSKAWHGTHQLRAGADVTRWSYSGTSDSHPVDLLRADGSLV
jgi:hypothetical protein